MLQRRFSSPLPSLDQAGDTIVEVLICIAVIASILGGAFLVSNHSSSQVRNSEEHAQALQLLQGQIEQLREEAKANTFASFPASDFCYQADGARVAAGGNNCIQGGFYTLSITKGVNPSFTATVKWEQVTGGTASEQLTYHAPVTS